MAKQSSNENRENKPGNVLPVEGDRMPFSPLVGFVLAILIALVAGVLVFQLGRLIYFGEIRLGGPEMTPNRIWLVRESENAGILMSKAAVVSGSLDGQQVCVNTRIWSLYWRRDESPDISGYCLCYERVNDAWRQAGECSAEVSP